MKDEDIYVYRFRKRMKDEDICIYRGLGNGFCIAYVFVNVFGHDDGLKKTMETDTNTRHISRAIN